MRTKKRKSGGRQVEVTIETLGGQGDGVGTFEGRPVFVPLALPGERLRVRLTGKRSGGQVAQPLELLEPARARREPPCPHFGSCGGCSLQHLGETEYRTWKRGLVLAALAHRGLPSDVVGDLISIPAATRRRATFAAERKGGRVHFGFHERQSHRVAGIETCLILSAGLSDLLPALRPIADQLLAEDESMTLSATETEGGVDLLLNHRRAPQLADRENLAAFALSAGLARIQWNGPDGLEPLALRAPAQALLGGVPVEVPPGGFLQPSREGEAALRDLVLRGIEGVSGRVLELFAGCGTFTFALARERPVMAVEGDQAALDALRKSADAAGLNASVATELRDLERRPIQAAELENFDAVVFDPPRDGAKDQSAEIAASSVAKVVAVSCNPRSFARDARILVDGGLVLKSVTPVDQFVWTPHVELVAVFVRP